MSELKYNFLIAFDLILVVSLLVTCVYGFRVGLLKSLFNTTGYIIGGIFGIFLISNYQSKIESTLVTVLLMPAIILISAVIGKYCLGYLGLSAHRNLPVNFLKFFDSIFGSLLYLTIYFGIFYSAISIFHSVPSFFEDLFLYVLVKQFFLD